MLIQSLQEILQLLLQIADRQAVIHVTVNLLQPVIRQIVTVIRVTAHLLQILVNQ